MDERRGTGEGTGGREGSAGEGGEEARRGEGAGQRSTRESVEEGIRQGLGVLTAFKEALEETITEARDRGDLSPERARAFMRDALARAQEAAEGTRERLDFATRKEVDELRAAMQALDMRVASLEDRLAARERSGGPEGD